MFFIIALLTIEQIITVSQIIGVLAGTITALTVLFKKTGLGKIWNYIWNRLIADPLRDWFKAVTAETVDERLDYTNDGNSFRDQINSFSKLAAKNSEGIAKNSEGISTLLKGQDHLCKRIIGMETKIIKISEKEMAQDELIDVLTEATEDLVNVVTSAD